MQLTTTYSLNCGLELAKPELYDLFYPLVHTEFITIDTENAPESQYHHWQDVIDFVHLYLNENKIAIYQLGRPDDKPLAGVNRTNGNLTPNQFSFVLKKSLVHLTTNNFSAHLASELKTKTIILNDKKIDPKEMLGADTKNLKILHAARNLTMDSNQPLINSIPPDEIAKALLRFLKIKQPIPYQTVFMGPKYLDGIEFVECIPNQALGLRAMGIPSIIYRMDLDYNVSNLFNQLKEGKCTIVSNRDIDIELLRKFKNNIQEFVYIVEKEHSPTFCKEVQHLGIPVALISYLDEKEINQYKLHYMDTSNIVPQKMYSFEDLPNYHNLNIDELYFKSHKYTFSNQKLFLSQASERHGVSAAHKTDVQKVINSVDFWKNLEIYAIFKKTS